MMQNLCKKRLNSPLWIRALLLIYNYVVGIIILLLALCGLILFSLGGIIKDDFNTIYFFIEQKQRKNYSF
jgi:hypothetical protein